MRSPSPLSCAPGLGPSYVFLSSSPAPPLGEAGKQEGATVEYSFPWSGILWKSRFPWAQAFVKEAECSRHVSKCLFPPALAGRLGGGSSCLHGESLAGFLQVKLRMCGGFPKTGWLDLLTFKTVYSELPIIHQLQVKPCSLAWSQGSCSGALWVSVHPSVLPSFSQLFALWLQISDGSGKSCCSLVYAVFFFLLWGQLRTSKLFTHRPETGDLPGAFIKWLVE